MVGHSTFFKNIGDALYGLMACNWELQSFVGRLSTLLHDKSKGFSNEMMLRNFVGFSVYEPIQVFDEIVNLIWQWVKNYRTYLKAISKNTRLYKRSLWCSL